MKILYCVCIVVTLIQVSIAPPVEKDHKKVHDGMYNTDGLDEKQAQDQEYYRYLTQIVGELEKDPNFSKMLDNVTEDDIKSGRIAEMYDLVGHDIRKKVDEVKRMEVEYQRDLLRQKKHHMTGFDNNYWNPIHHDNKDTFDKEDFQKLIRRHNDMIGEQDKLRHEEYRIHELEKERQRREALKNMTAEEKVVAEQKHNESHHKEHEKIHEPGHKAQLEEVWEKEDGFDPDSFDPKTFFNYHDKNSDGHWDYFEQESLFLNELDKVYNETDPDTDIWEREEEMERMRTHMLKSMDHDDDGLISLDEFMSESKTAQFADEDEWKPLTEEDQYTDAEFDKYERLMEQTGDPRAISVGDSHETNTTEPQTPKVTDEPEKNTKDGK